MSNLERCSDLIKLAKELKSEKLFIQSELESLQYLNDKLERNINKVIQLAWTNTQQRFNIKQLFAQSDVQSSSCCQKIGSLLCPIFVDAHKVLKYQDTLVLSSLIQHVRNSPALVSLWLAIAEEMGPISIAEVVRLLCSGFYGCDITPLCKVLLYIVHHRLSKLVELRRPINSGSCSFTHLYCEIVENYRPAQLFLYAILKVPMLPLLQIDVCLVVDPDKVMERITKNTNINNINDWNQQLLEYRNWTISTLSTIVEKFINSLRELWMCFPPIIASMIQQTVSLLKENQQISEEDIHFISTSMIFTNFICRAIINPDSYGITDIPITNVNRYNLGQVALTLQTLSLMKYQEVDTKYKDLYSKFEKNCVYSLVDTIVENQHYSSSIGDGSFIDTPDNETKSNICSIDDKIIPRTKPVINSNTVLFTRNDIQLFVSAMKKIPSILISGLNSLCDEKNDKLVNVKDEVDRATNFDDKKNDNISENSSKDSNSIEDAASGISYISDDINKLENINSPQGSELYYLLKSVEPEIILKIQKLLKKLPDSNFNRESIDTSNDISPLIEKNLSDNYSTKLFKSNEYSQEVLIIKLPGDSTYEPIGMISENKVLEYHYSNIDNCTSEEILQGVNLPDKSTVQFKLPEPNACISDLAFGSNNTGNNNNSYTGQEKRTRFSLSHDEGSIGNTSDNLEAVSEAASNHSVTSSLEMETEDQNDNLSDMVSANVSGRGSPNISGRDTPSSQVTDGDGANSQQQRQPNVVQNSSSTVHRQPRILRKTRHDIEDKFCKFEIKKLVGGDETFSILSDTWSTDVLASDSEMINELTYEKNTLLSTLNQPNSTAAMIETPMLLATAPPPPDASETASESAWSIDGLVSDSDRLTEISTFEAIPPSNKSINETVSKMKDIDLRSNETDNSNDSDRSKPPMIQVMSNGSATSRWLNDPSQMFPEQPNHLSLNTINLFSQDVNNLCKNMESTTLLKPNSIPDSNSNNTTPESNHKNYIFKYNERNNVKHEIKTEHSHFGDFFSNNDEGGFNKVNNLNKSKLDYDNAFKNNATYLNNRVRNTCNDANQPDFFNAKHDEMTKSQTNENSSSYLDQMNFKILKKNYSESNLCNLNESQSNHTPANKTSLNKSCIVSSSPIEKNSDSQFKSMNKNISKISTKLAKTLNNKPCSSDLFGNNNNIVKMENCSDSLYSSYDSSYSKFNNESNEINDENNGLSKQSALYNVSIKPGISTGAIPKSISFDETAEKHHRNVGFKNIDENIDSLGINFGDLKNNMKKSGGNLLNKIKSFRNKNRGGSFVNNFGKRNEIDESLSKSNEKCIIFSKDYANIVNAANHCKKSSHELSDDILAKYRKKTPPSGSGVASGYNGLNENGQRKNDILPNYKDDMLVPDLALLTSKKSDNDFEILRKELRIILSDMDIHNIELASMHSASIALTCALRLEGAIDGLGSSRALGALAILDSTNEPLVLKSLETDYVTRRPYLNYLVGCRKSLLTSIADLKSECIWRFNEIKRQKALAIAIRTRNSLTARESHLIALQKKLQTGLVDEKREALAAALETLLSEITGENFWADSSEWELEQTKLTIERVVLGRFYRLTMFPNGDGDIMRDQLLSNHMTTVWGKLNEASVTSPNGLQSASLVPAESILNCLSVYKTPRDKVNCVVRLAKNIINILTVSIEGVPGADELLPVMVYIILKVRPSSLLSTVQFVNTFIDPPLEGEQLYCWTQFCAAVEHIKTMD